MNDYINKTQVTEEETKRANIVIIANIAKTLSEEDYSKFVELFSSKLPESFLTALTNFRTSWRSANGL